MDMFPGDYIDNILVDSHGISILTQSGTYSQLLICPALAFSEAAAASDVVGV